MLTKIPLLLVRGEDVIRLLSEKVPALLLESSAVRRLAVGLSLGSDIAFYNILVDGSERRKLLRGLLSV